MPRHYEQELRSIESLEEYRAARIREKRLYMERWGLMSTLEGQFDECSLHEVEVQMDGMSKDDILAFAEQEFLEHYELLEVKDNYVRFLCFLDFSYDPAEIDVILFYIFGDYERGVYRSYHIR